MPERSGSLRPFWSGTIAFGLVSVPVALFPGTRRERVSLRMLAPDGTPLRRRYFCAKEQVPLDSDEIVRGYEVEAGRFVTVDDEELDRLAPEKSREIDLRRFVPREEIDPRFFDRAYLLTPTGPSNKAYRLLAEVMERSGRAGIATFVMRGTEYLVAILAEDGILRAEALRFADEVRTPDAVGLPEPGEAPKASVREIRKVVKELAADELDPAELEDDADDALRELASRKRAAGEDVVEAPEEAEPRAQVVDLMASLKESLQRGAEGTERKAG